MIIAFCEKEFLKFISSRQEVRVIHVESSSDTAPQCAKMCLEISKSHLIPIVLKARNFKVSHTKATCDVNL